MSFQDVRPDQVRQQRYYHNRGQGSAAAGNDSAGGGGQGRRGPWSAGRGGLATPATKQGGFGSGGPLRTGGVGSGRTQSYGGTEASPSARSLHHGGVARTAAGRVTQQSWTEGGPSTATGAGSTSGGGKVGDYLMIYSQNVTMLHRMVQQLGTTRDTAELRGQCRCQMDVIGELRGKIQAELILQQQEAEKASRQDAARLMAMKSKLTKDFNRVNAIAVDLTSKAERRMREVDAQRQQQQEAEEERARAAFDGAGAGDGRYAAGAGLLEVQQRRERVQMQEEAINTAIIQETEEELQQINTSLYKVNEIYRDLANIVEQQQEAVDQIENNTEGAHARAQEGLVQVQKASDYQPSCTVS